MDAVQELERRLRMSESGGRQNLLPFTMTEEDIDALYPPKHLFAPVFLRCESHVYMCHCFKRRNTYFKNLKNLSGHGGPRKYARGCRCIPCKRGRKRRMRIAREKTPKYQPPVEPY